MPHADLNIKPNPEVTRLLQAWRSGDSGAMDQLMPLVYAQLRRIAAHYMRQERPDHTLRATALVHEAYLKLLATDVVWEDRIHFLSIAAITMRRILVDHARTNRRVKRGSGARKVTWEDALLLEQSPGRDMLDLDEVLTRLSEQDTRKARLIELTYFGGMNCEEAAAALQISTATVNRDLKLAKAWLRQALECTSSSM